MLMTRTTPFMVPVDDANPAIIKNEALCSECGHCFAVCEEEIGVPPKEVTVIGKLSDVYIPLSNFNITPFVGTIPEMPNFVLSKNEVEKVIIIPLKDLLNDKNKTSQVLYRQEQKIIAPGYKIGENFIWGATAMMIAELEAMVKNEQ